MIDIIVDINRDYSSKLSHLNEIMIVDEDSSFFSRKVILSGENDDLFYISRSLLNKKDIKEFLESIKIHKISELDDFKIYKHINVVDAIIDIKKDSSQEEIYEYISELFNVEIREGTKFIIIKGKSKFDCIIRDIDVSDTGKIIIDTDILNQKDKKIFLNNNGEIEGYYFKVFD